MNNFFPLLTLPAANPGIVVDLTVLCLLLGGGDSSWATSSCASKVFLKERTSGSIPSKRCWDKDLGIFSRSNPGPSGKIAWLFTYLPINLNECTIISTHINGIPSKGLRPEYLQLHSDTANKPAIVTTLTNIQPSQDSWTGGLFGTCRSAWWLAGRRGRNDRKSASRWSRTACLRHQTHPTTTTIKEKAPSRVVELGYKLWVLQIFWNNLGGDHAKVWAVSVGVFTHRARFSPAFGQSQKCLLCLAVVLLVFIVQTDARPQVPQTEQRK